MRCNMEIAINDYDVPNLVGSTNIDELGLLNMMIDKDVTDKDIFDILSISLLSMNGYANYNMDMIAEYRQKLRDKGITKITKIMRVNYE